MASTTLPVGAKRLAELVDAAWRATDAHLLRTGAIALARALGGSWPGAAGVDPPAGPESLIEAYAEQFAVDPRGVRGGLDDALEAALTRAGAFDFVNALNIVDGYLRACMLLGLEPREARPGAAGHAAVRNAGPPPRPTGGDGTARRAYHFALVDAGLRDARATFAAAARRLTAVDELTTEAVRLRNAWFHDCHY